MWNCILMLLIYVLHDVACHDGSFIVQIERIWNYYNNLNTEVRSPMNNKTINYYNKYAKSFIQTTRSVDFKNIQNKFLSCLPPKASILDFGCGSGRDTKYFLKQNYKVTAIDGSESSFYLGRTGIVSERKFERNFL